MFFKEFDHKFQNTYFTERLSVAASKIHKFLTSLMKLPLEMKLLLDFTVLKSSVGISYEPAQNMFKVNNKDIKTTSIDLPPVCWVASCLPFVKICGRYVQLFRKVVPLQIRRKLCNA